MEKKSRPICRDNTGGRWKRVIDCWCVLFRIQAKTPKKEEVLTKKNHKKSSSEEKMTENGNGATETHI